MQIITDQVYEFSKDNKPCATAKPGEVLQFNTQDCFSNHTFPMREHHHGRP